MPPPSAPRMTKGDWCSPEASHVSDAGLHVSYSFKDMVFKTNPVILFICHPPWPSEGDWSSPDLQVSDKLFLTKQSLIRGKFAG